MEERKSKLERMFPGYVPPVKNEVVFNENDNISIKPKCMFDTSSINFITSSLHFRNYKSCISKDLEANKVLKKIKKGSIIPCVCPEVITEICNDGNEERRKEMLTFLKDNNFKILNEDKKYDYIINKLAYDYIYKDIFGNKSIKDAKITATANYFGCDYIYSSDNHFVNCNTLTERRNVNISTQKLENNIIITEDKKEKFNLRLYDMVNKKYNLNSARIVGLFSQRNK